MRALGLNPSEDDVKKIIDGIDPSGKQKWGWGTCRRNNARMHSQGFVGVCVCINADVHLVTLCSWTD